MALRNTWYRTTNMVCEHIIGGHVVIGSIVASDSLLHVPTRKNNRLVRPHLSLFRLVCDDVMSLYMGPDLIDGRPLLYGRQECRVV